MREFLRSVISGIRSFLGGKLHYESGDLPYYITVLLALVIFVVALNGFVDLTEELFHNRVESFDRDVSSFFVARRRDFLTSYFLFMTWLGGGYGYGVIISVLMGYFLFIHRSRQFIIKTLIVLLVATLCNVVMKEVFQRPRPSAEHLVPVYTLSYPSGHAMSATAFYGFLIFLAIRYPLRPLVRFLLIVVLLVIILSIGGSRIYLGVHYPSDVLAGFIGGVIWITFCITLFDIIDLMRRRQGRKMGRGM